MHFKAIRNYLILLGVVVVLVVAYTLGGFFGVPRLLRSQLQQFASEHYGRPVAVGEIRFNPYTLALEVRDFSFADADHQPLVAFGRLFVNLDIASVWRRGASFSDIEIERPVARLVIRPDGSLNFADLARPFATTGKPATPPVPSEPTRLFVERMRVSESALTFEDLTRATPFRAKLTPVTFELRDFSTTEKTGNAYALRGASSEGEKFSWSGSFALAPLASRGRFQLENVQARTLWSYLRESLGFQVSSGIVALSGDYDFAATPQGVGLKVNVSDVDVSDLGMRPRQGDADYVHLTRLNIADTQLDLARRRVEVGKVHLAGAEVRAWRESDGRINLLELMKAPGAQEPAPPAEKVSASAEPSPSATAPTSTDYATPPAWTVSVPDIGIEQVKVAAEDRFVKPTAVFALDPIEIHVGGFTTAPDAPLDLDASIGINRTGQLKVRGKTTLGSTNFRGEVDLRGLDLTAFQPYLATYTQMTLQSGVLATKLDIDLPADGALIVKGETDVGRLRTIDNALRQDFIKWERLQVSGIEYRAKPAGLQPAGLKIASVVANTPYVRAIIAPDQTVNIAKVLSAPASAPGPVQSVRTPTKEPDAVGTQQPMPVSIGSVRIANGSANFADFWITPNYAVSLQGLNGSITGLSSERKSRAKMRLEGKVDRYAPALIEGDVNLLSASLYTDLKVSFKGVDMSSVTPYSGRFAGYRIEKGKLSVDVAYHVENRQLKAQQRFVIDQLQLGERVESKDAIRLPLRLAVALLKDRNGVIDLDLPVTGSLDDPKFRLGPIIWKAVINLLGKIATAPFALLGRLFGGGEEMNLVDFEPGAAALTPAGQEKVTALVKAMKERPQLQLDVPATYSPEVDKPLLAQKRLEDKLTRLAESQGSQGAARKRKEPEPAAQSVLADPARRFDLLVAQYRVDFGADAALPPAAQEAFAAGKKKREPPMLEAANTEIAAAISQKDAVPDSDLEELGEARAHAIQDALLGAGEIDATRVFLIAANAKPPAAGKVRIELSLK